MTVMLCRNRVVDFAKWKTVFDANTGDCCAAGLRLQQLWQDIGDPNNVFFLFEGESIERAKAFINDPASAEAGKASGVIDGECHFLESCTAH